MAKQPTRKQLEDTYKYFIEQHLDENNVDDWPDNYNDLDADDKDMFFNDYYDDIDQREVKKYIFYITEKNNLESLPHEKLKLIYTNFYNIIANPDQKKKLNKDFNKLTNNQKNFFFNNFIFLEKEIKKKLMQPQPERDPKEIKIQTINPPQINQEISKQDIINKLKQKATKNITNLDNINGTEINLSSLNILKNNGKQSSNINSFLFNLYNIKDSIKTIDNGFIFYVTEQKYNILLKQFRDMELYLKEIEIIGDELTYQDILNSYDS